MSMCNTPAVTVRNTFVHISSARSARRSKTQPAPRIGSVQHCHRFSQHRFTNDNFDIALPQALVVTDAIDHIESAAEEIPPSPINLCREVTDDGYSDPLPSYFLEQQINDCIGGACSDDRNIGAFAKPSCIDPPPSRVPMQWATASPRRSLPSCCPVFGVCPDGTPPPPAAFCREVTADGFEDSLFQPALQCVESAEDPNRRAERRSRRRPKPPRPAAGPPPQVLVRSRADSGSVVFRWAVDAKKLRGSDQLAVSPPFEIRLGSRALSFRLVAVAAAVGPPGGGRGSGTFRSSNGRGNLRLKCETLGDATTSNLIFRFSIGPGNTIGPCKLEDDSQSDLLEHDFALNGIYTCKDEWDFAKVVNEGNQAFYVSLEV